MTKPRYQDYHTDVPLTNLSIAFNPAGYIAAGVFPRISVQRITDKFFIYSKGDWLRREAKPRAPGTRSVRGGYGLSTSQYTAIEYAFATPVTDEQVRNSDNPLRPLEDGTKFVTRQLLAEQESQVAAIALGTSIWTGSATPAVTWNNPTSTPLEDVQTGFESVVSTIGQMPNLAVLGYNVWSDLKDHPDIVSRISGAAGPESPAIVSQKAVAGLFGVDKLLIGVQIENTGLEGGTDTMAFIWGKHLLLAYVTSSPALMEPTAGYIFTYQDRKILRFREEQEGQDVIDGRWSFDVQQTAPDAGYVFRSVVA